jgi:uncharacterized protein (UPF0332 family)
MNNEQKLMLEKSESKLKTARIDFENGQYGDSISRSYYAVFHAISAVLFHRNLVFSYHSQVIGAFNKEFVKEGIFPKSFTAIIQGLFADRQTGDYDVIDIIDKVAAEAGLRDATHIVNAINEYLK